ncbi:TPA: fimbrial protein [Escherichia coli]
MGKTISIKVLFGIYLLLMAGKVFAFSCNVDGGSSIGAGTTSVYVNLDPVIQPGQNLVVDLSQHISCWNDYGGWYDTDHINLVQGSAFAGSLQSYKGSLYWNNVTYPFPLTTNTNVLEVEFNTLTVINNVNVHYPLEVYHFLKSIGSKHMQFIELLETGTPNIDFSGHSENTFRIIDFSVPPTAYGKFMSTIFMQWVKNDVGEIFIRQFESFVSRFLGNGHTSCIFQESCKDNLVVESNGDIYECDHFVYPQYKIGNINKSELKTMNSVQLTAQKKRISAKCLKCAYKPICNGGCPKHRITKVNNETVSYFCEGYKILFSTMVPYMNAMVELAKNRVPLYHIMDVAKQMENN